MYMYVITYKYIVSHSEAEKQRNQCLSVVEDNANKYDDGHQCRSVPENKRSNIHHTKTCGFPFCVCRRNDHQPRVSVKLNPC